MKIREENDSVNVPATGRELRNALLLSAILVCQFGFWQSTRAEDFCRTNVPVADRGDRPFEYKDFRSGWVAYGYSKESIEDAIQDKNAKQLTYHLVRLCQVTEGLRPFSKNLDEPDDKQLQVGLNQLQGVLAAMNNASNSGDWLKFGQLEQQFSSVDDSIKSAVPPCWRAPLKDTGKRGRINLARNISCR